MTHEQLIAAGWTRIETGDGCFAYIRPGEFIDIHLWKKDGKYTAEFSSYSHGGTLADNDGRCYSTAAGALADLGAYTVPLHGATETIAEHCCGEV